VSDGRVPRPYGRLREAKRTARFRLHGRDQAVPAPDRLPADAARDGKRITKTKDSLAERVEFELTGDLRSGLLAINNRRADDHCPRIPLRVG
jgi:hypothetical protein